MTQGREVVLDTETTGLNKMRDKVIEIGCCELINKVETGRYFHVYINPQCEVSEGALRIHNISNAFLSDKPKFNEIAQEFMSFIGNSVLIIHNAQFDLHFLNTELSLLGLSQIHSARVIDTLLIARKKYPKSPVNLDALCRRFNVSLENRQKHGALTDARLLAAVYISMHSAKQSEIKLNEYYKSNSYASTSNVSNVKRNLSYDEVLRHQELLKKIKNPLWSNVAASNYEYYCRDRNPDIEEEK